MKLLFIAFLTLISAGSSFATEVGAAVPTSNQITVHDATYFPYFERDTFHLKGVDSKNAGILNCSENSLEVLEHSYAFDSQADCHAAMALLVDSVPQHNVIFTVQDDGRSHFRVVSVKPQ